MIQITVLERGEVRKLELDEADLQTFQDALTARGGMILERKKTKAESRRFHRKLGPEAWAPWFSALARTLKGSIALDQALLLLAEAAPLPDQVIQLHRDVVAGKRFSDAAASHLIGLPDLIPSLLKAGEAAGDLARGAALAHRSLEDMVAFKRELTSRLAYPLVVVSACTIALVVLMLKVVPAMLGMWDNLGKALPPGIVAVRFLGWAGAVVLLALAIGLAWLMKGSEGAQRLPGFRELGRHRNRSEAWSALAMALGGGVSLLDALNLLGGRWGAHLAREAIQSGVRPEKALESWVDDAPGQRAILTASLRIGDLAGGAQNVAEGYRELLHQDLQKLQRWLEPAVLILLGGILMFLAWSLFSLLGEMEHGLR